MKQWIGLALLGFSTGMFYNVVQERRKKRREKWEEKKKANAG